MAWLDNRMWAHPKAVNLTDKAFRVWINGLCYSSGFVTNGRLTLEQQRILGSTPKIRKELENARLWLDEGPDILIKDWDEHNGERDRKAEERRRQAKERQAKARKGVKETDWRAARQKLFERDGGECADCGQVTERWHADHMPDRDELRAQGIDLCDIDYIQTRCTSCHAKRTMRANVTANETANVSTLTDDRMTDDSKDQNLCSNEQALTALEHLTRTTLKSVEAA